MQTVKKRYHGDDVINIIDTLLMVGTSSTYTVFDSRLLVIFL